MRYPASEKLEIIRLVEESALAVRRTLEKVGIARATFYRWYDLYQAGGPEALDDRHPRWKSPPCRRGNWPCASPTPKIAAARTGSVLRFLIARPPRRERAAPSDLTPGEICQCAL